MRIHRGRIAQHKHDQHLREYLKQNLNELIQHKELIIDGKVKTQIATLDLPTLQFAQDVQYLALCAASGGSGSGAGRAPWDARGPPRRWPPGRAHPCQEPLLEPAIAL